jgi:hypothetical protein
MARFDALGDQVAAELEVTEAIFDGEVIAADDTGRPLFYDLLRRSGRPAYVAFDLLWQNGTDLRPMPISERRTRLRHILPVTFIRFLRGTLRRRPGTRTLRAPSFTASSSPATRYGLMVFDATTIARASTPDPFRPRRRGDRMNRCRFLMLSGRAFHFTRDETVRTNFQSIRLQNELFLPCSRRSLAS